MLNFSKREFLVGGALMLVLNHTRCACANDVEARGCQLSPQGFDKLAPRSNETQTFLTGQEPIIQRSGDRAFDFALAQTLSKLSQMFEVLPGFAFYDDGKSHNAYATSRSRLERADGTVLFGLQLLRTLKSKREHPEVGVAAVCAHEFGHILQFKLGLSRVVDEGQQTVKRSELQADYFAGYFAGKRKLERDAFPSSVVITTQSNFGDHDTGDRNHHGTPRERATAVSRGFEAAFSQHKSLSEAISESTTYVMGIR